MAKISNIEGIGETYAQKLVAAGVKTVEALLSTGADKKGRQDLAKFTDISEALILNWVNRADLTRIKGVSTQYADLLECAGVDSVPELSQRNAMSLTQKMQEVNTHKKLVRRVAPQKNVDSWIEQAKVLPKAVFH